MFKGMQNFQNIGETEVNMKPRLIIAILALLLVAPVIANPNGPPWKNGSDLVIDTGLYAMVTGPLQQRLSYQFPASQGHIQ